MPDGTVPATLATTTPTQSTQALHTALMAIGGELENIDALLTTAAHALREQDCDIDSDVVGVLEDNCWPRLEKARTHLERAMDLAGLGDAHEYAQGSRPATSAAQASSCDATHVNDDSDEDGPDLERRRETKEDAQELAWLLGEGRTQLAYFAHLSGEAEDTLHNATCMREYLTELEAEYRADSTTPDVGNFVYGKWLVNTTIDNLLRFGLEQLKQMQSPAAGQAKGV